MTVPPIETESWPGTGPLLEWILRMMPPGGLGYGRREVPPEEIGRLADEFLASLESSAATHDAAMHAERLLDFQAGYGTGEPLLWGSAFVERLMCDLYPRKVLADEAFMLAMPDVLRALVRYANNRSDVPPELTADVLDTVDACEEAYRVLVSDDGPLDELFGPDGFPGSRTSHLLTSARRGDMIRQRDTLYQELSELG